MAILGKKTPEKLDHTIDVDASMQGTMTFKDPVNLRINGKFDGSLEVKGNLTIGETASVNANIKGETIVIAGRVKGDIDATSKIELKNSSIIEGNIKTPRLVMEDGALFQGKCVMIESILNIDELSRHLELDKDTIVDWAGQGKIPGFKDGEDWKFERKRIDDWVASGRVR